MADNLKRNLKTALVVAFIAALIILFVRPEYRQGGPSLSGTPEKNFAFTLDGKPAHLSDLRGRVVVLNFWASWCQPCIEEMPSLDALQKWLAPRGGLVLGVNAGVQDDPASYSKFLTDYKIAFPTYFDSSAKIAAGYGTRMYPETYIIDRRGILQRKLIGAQDWTNPLMTAYLSSLLSKN